MEEMVKHGQHEKCSTCKYERIAFFKSRHKLNNSSKPLLTAIYTQHPCQYPLLFVEAEDGVIVLPVQRF